MEQWYSINKKEDIDYLMQEFGGFHDACLVGSTWSSGVYVDEQGSMCFGSAEDRRLHVVFHSQWMKDKALELCFSGVRRHCLGGWQERYGYEMFDCYLKIHTDLQVGRDDSLIVWADGKGFSPLNILDRSLLAEPMWSYIIADKLQWRFIEK